MFRLRLKTKTGGQYNLSGRVDGNNSMADLRAAIKDLTSILPERQRILIGFPPKPVQSTNCSLLSIIGIRNGEVIIVEDVEPALNGVKIGNENKIEENDSSKNSDCSNALSHPPQKRVKVEGNDSSVVAQNSSLPTDRLLTPADFVENSTKSPANKSPPAAKLFGTNAPPAIKSAGTNSPSLSTAARSSSPATPSFNEENFYSPEAQGILLKKVVPSDNSCLFASVHYLIKGFIDTSKLREVREIVANYIAAHPDLYNEAILEKSNKEYCKWILKETSWGGAIELSILSEHYQVEVVAIDAKTGLLNRFGEDKFYPKRIIVMYDGIHYDPIHMETFEGGIQTIFSTTNASILQQAQDIAEQAKHCGLYTDTNTFTLECKQCGTIIRGDDQALQHAKSTGHSKFEECRKK